MICDINNIMLVSRMMIFLILKVLKFDEVSFRAKKREVYLLFKVVL